MGLVCRSSAILVCVGLVAGLPAAAGRLEQEVDSRWLGARVITRTESFSACSGFYTDNRVNGTLVRSSGPVAFAPGELGTVDKIDVNRSRIDVLVEIAEPMLLSYAEGPFTLYREAVCRIEFEVEVPRESVKARDVAAIDAALTRVFDRHASIDAAVASAEYNRRRRDDYPEDYDRTLAELAVWRAERTNAAVHAGLDAATETAARLAGRIEGDPDYLAGFSVGVERTRSTLRDECGVLVAIDPEAAPIFEPDMTPDERRRLRGEADGTSLIRALTMLHRLPACFVPVPGTGDSFELAASD